MSEHRTKPWDQVYHVVTLKRGNRDKRNLEYIKYSQFKKMFNETLLSHHKRKYPKQNDIDTKIARPRFSSAPGLEKFTGLFK